LKRLGLVNHHQLKGAPSAPFLLYQGWKFANLTISKIRNRIEVDRVGIDGQASTLGGPLVFVDVRHFLAELRPMQ